MEKANDLSFIKMMCFMAVAAIGAVFSKILWLLPIQLFAENFYKTYFVYSSNNIVFWIMLMWFMIGAARITHINLLNNKNWNLIVVAIFAPLAIFMKSELIIKRLGKA